ncbi:MAG: hypothetical protein ACREDK_02480 [Thermoplasmata archaeon]
MSDRIPKSALGTAIISTVVVAVLVLPYLAYRSAADAYTLGAIAGIPSGFLLSIFLYWVTGPTLRAEIAPSKYDGVSSGYWVHLVVRNASWNVLGSGTARECVGKVRFVGMRRLSVSWKSRPNPLRDMPVALPGGGSILLKVADPALYDQKRTNSIRPYDPDADEKWLDIAYRPKGSENAYVSIPEHFQGPGMTLFDDLKLEVGEHPFSVEFEFAGGRSKPDYFTLVNKGGNSMTSESLFIRPATKDEKARIQADLKPTPAGARPKPTAPAS